MEETMSFVGVELDNETPTQTEPSANEAAVEASQPQAQTEKASTAKVKKKKIGRGIASAKGTTKLKFSHEHAKQNGLFIAHLDEVTISEIKIGEDTTGLPSFNGLSIPRLTFAFSSNEPEVNKRHYAYLSFNAVESNVDTIPGGKYEWKVNQAFDWIRHLLDVYALKGRALTDKEAAALSLPFDDFDEQGEYVSVEPETVIAGWKALFTNVALMFNKGNKGNPIFKTNEGKDIPVWIKLIRYIKARSAWKAISNGELTFPTFVGEGAVELYTANAVPSIRIDSVKESIIPMQIDETPKAPNLTAPTIAGVSIPVGPGMPSIESPVAGGIPSMDTSAIAIEASEDMPF